MWPMGAGGGSGAGVGAAPGSAAWTVVDRDAQNPHAGPAINVWADAQGWNHYDLRQGEKIAALPQRTRRARQRQVTPDDPRDK